MKKISYYTKEGFDDIKKKLYNLKNKERKEISKQISEARDKGDLSENFEYHAAKDLQSLLEIKIFRLESLIFNSKVISKSDVNKSEISILTKVRIKNENTGNIFTYTIVSEEEANIKFGKISINSPIGTGLLGKKPGDIVTINAPGCILKFKIIEIEK
ncbi:MAG: transcription elongation factor GreA [Cytophagales bacterium]|jgi:transcription elongation factor GreA